MDDRLYVFFGNASEYVLNPLYREMVSRGFMCVELDISLSSEPAEFLKRIKSKGNDIVFITSAHVFLNQKHYDFECPNPESDSLWCRNNISALEAMNILEPVKNVFYPHDLLDGFHHADRLWFSLFDLYLAPLPASHGNRFTKVTEVGWIKKKRRMPEIILEERGDSLKINIGHAMGESEFYARMGTDYTYDTFKNVWKYGVKVKTHDYDRMRPMEKMFAERGVDFYPRSTSVFELIEDSPLVITNGLTSVNVEASLSGRMVLNILAGDYDEDAQKKLVAGFPHLRAIGLRDAPDFIKEILTGSIPLEAGADIIKTFDYDGAINAIMSL